ncbi:MAG: hypothetical protein IPG74_12610 [Flavobacteriales bacterium]|nr:hypothetical protein [Flavobacteriales bacterium]
MARNERFLKRPCSIIPLANMPRAATTRRVALPTDNHNGIMLNHREYSPFT